MRAAWPLGLIVSGIVSLLPVLASSQPRSEPQAQPPSPAVTAPSPAWVSEVVGHYAGLVLNAGRMECHRTDLTLQDGRLVGHYWIEDADPFEGTLSDFVPESDTGGSFTWTDRYGSGSERLVFDVEHDSFSGAWGADRPTMSNPIRATRGTSCRPPAISRAGPPSFTPASVIPDRITPDGAKPDRITSAGLTSAIRNNADRWLLAWPMTPFERGSL